MLSSVKISPFNLLCWRLYHNRLPFETKQITSQFCPVTLTGVCQVFLIRVGLHQLESLPYYVLLLFLWEGWNWIHLARRPQFCLLYQSRMIDDYEYGTVGGIKIGRGTRSTRWKPAPMPLSPPQIPCDLTWNWNRAAAVGNRRVTAWAMERPYSILNRSNFDLLISKYPRLTHPLYEAVVPSSPQRLCCAWHAPWPDFSPAVFRRRTHGTEGRTAEVGFYFAQTLSELRCWTNRLLNTSGRIKS
jgi:hypothetical protein